MMFLNCLLGLLLSGDPSASSPSSFAADDWTGTYYARGEAAEIDNLLMKADGTFECMSQEYEAFRLLKDIPKDLRDAGVGGICGNSLHAVYSGKWQMDSSIVTLEFEPGPNSKVPARWMAVMWDGRRYLVPEGRIVDFCNEVNFGFEPRTQRDGRFALLDGDHEKPARGWPTLAEEWRSFLLQEPIQGKLERIDEDGFGYLDIGEASGLRAGMVLLAYHEGQMRSWRLKVLCPCGPSARVDIIEIPRMEMPKPRDVMPGDLVTTRAL